MSEKVPFYEVVPFYPVEVLKTEDYFLYPAQVMKEAGYPTEILTFGSPIREEVVDGIRVRRFSGPLSLYKSLPKEAFLHCHGMTRDMLALYLLLYLFKKRYKSILTAHTSFGIYPPYASKFPIHKIGRFIFSHFHKIIAISPYEKDFYLQNRFRNISLVSLAIDYNFFSRIKENNYKDADFPARYGIREGIPALLFIGGDREIKRPKTVIRAFNLLKKENPAPKLFMVGFSDDTGIANLMAEADIQYRDDLFFFKRTDPYSNIYSDIFRASDIFINSSANEGFPLGVCEAAAAGIALCLSEIGPLKSVYGAAALYHHPDDHHKLKENILNYLYDHRKREADIRTNKLRAKDYDYPAIKRSLGDVCEEVFRGD